MDYPENLDRFKITYKLFSVKYSTKLRLKIVLDKITPVKTLRTAILKLSEHIKDLMYYVNTRILILMSSQFVLSNF